jgi:hypothetical protein
MIALDAIVDAAADTFRVPRGALLTGGRNFAAGVEEARRAAIFLADRHSGRGVDALATFFAVARTAIYYNVRAAEAALATDRAPHLATIEEMARAIDVSARELAGKPFADASEVAHRIIVEDDTEISSDELRALAHAVLRSTPAPDNPVVTELIVAAVEAIRITAGSRRMARLEGAIGAALRSFDAPAEVPFQ